ncbi:MAG: Asp23/Gls24 family envelope stress response protein [Lachnospiraceae bacterium]|nr:Asp23/Gls24 family envelope stress response protein [Lachnospiraceae bacterium]
MANKSEGVHYDTKYGEILISPKVIAKTAGLAACESFGVVGMAAVNLANGLTTLLKSEELGKGVVVEINDNEIKIELHIIVAFSVNVKACCDNVIENVKYKVEELTGLKINELNIYVEGVRVID